MEEEDQEFKVILSLSTTYMSPYQNKLRNRNTGMEMSVLFVLGMEPELCARYLSTLPLGTVLEGQETLGRLRLQD